MQQSKLCQKHNEEIIAIDCADQDTPLCLKCIAPLLKKQQVVTIDTATETLSNIKQQFHIKLEEQNNKNLEKIKSLLSGVIQKKTTIEQQFNKVIENLQQWITAIEEQSSVIKQKVNELSTLKTQEFQQTLIQLQQNNTNIIELKSTIQQQLTLIGQSENIQNSLNLLNSIEFIEQNTDCQLIDQEQIFDQNRTPNLKLLCNEHNTEIIMFDLNEKRNSENRLACVYCIQELNVKYTAIKGAEQQWNEYKQQKNNEINKYEEQQKQKINQLKQIFQSLNEVYQTTINNIFTYLDQILLEIEQLTTQHTQEFNKDWNLYTRKEFIVIAETLSIVKTQGLQQLNIDKELNEKELGINKRINDELLKLNEKLQQSNDNIKMIIQFNEIKVNNEIQTQTDYITQDQNNQIQVKLQDNDCQTILKESKGQNIQTDKQFNESQTLEISYKQQVNYKQLDQYTIQQNEYCRCLCFNKDKNILAVGCDYDIKIFKFENGKMTEIQLLKDHKSNVYALYMGNNNQIYSCSCDHTIKIYIYQSNLWIKHQSLYGHTSYVLCLTMNKAEDQLITGSSDRTINSWMKTQDQWKCVQTLQNYSHNVSSLSLNESQNQLLSCGDENKLNIFKCDSNKQWSLTQTITANDQVYRASFINDNIIVHQMMNKGILKVYEYNQTEFKQKQDIKVKGSGGCQRFFPQAYCKQQSILLNKNCQFINIIRIKKDNQFVVEQEIEYKSNQLYGTITNDGQFLVTWDNDSKQIQVRQLQ